MQSLVVFGLLFPFVPSIVPGTDTQPTFLLITGLWAGAVLLRHAGENRGIQSNARLPYVFVAVIAYVSFSIMLSSVITGEFGNFARTISFIQFCVAAFWSYANVERMEKINFRLVIGIYVAFTLVFFLTNGALEAVLIHSRSLGHFANLAVGGRGASTLSPEPSFFARHVFNLYIMKLLSSRPGRTRRGIDTVWLLVIVCLISSLSGYGLGIMIAMMFVTFPGLFVGGIAVTTLAREQVIDVLDNITGIRAMNLLVSVLREPNLVLLVSDVSFSSRLVSFRRYLEDMVDHPLFGNGFSLVGGGGFVGIVAAFGFIGVLAFGAFVLEVAFLHNTNWRTRVLVMFWLVMNTLSGPIGVPPLGAILGLIIARNHRPCGATTNCVGSAESPLRRGRFLLSALRST